MEENWHSIIFETNAMENMMGIEVKVPSESPWFMGHFPNNPIVPGVALIAFVIDAVKYYEKKRGNQIRISGVKRVRFRKAIRPDDSISISISPEHKKQNLSYAFTVLCKGGMACSGIVSAEQLSHL